MYTMPVRAPLSLSSIATPVLPTRSTPSVQNDRRNQNSMVLVLRLHNQLFDIRGILVIQLEASRTQGLPLCVLLFQEHFALHLR